MLCDKTYTKPLPVMVRRVPPPVPAILGSTDEIDATSVYWYTPPRVTSSPLPILTNTSHGGATLESSTQITHQYTIQMFNVTHYLYNNVHESEVYRTQKGIFTH